MSKKFVDMSILSSEDMDLILQGIDKLLAEDIKNNRYAIFQILEEYPEVKEKKFADEKFKQAIFDYFKLKHNHNIINKRDWQDIEILPEQFSFLIPMILNDIELQETFKVFAMENIDCLLNMPSRINDGYRPGNSETSYDNCEKFFDSVFVSNEIKQGLLPLLKDVLHRWYERTVREIGRDESVSPRLNKIHVLVKRLGGIDMVSQAMWSARCGSEKGDGDDCSPSLLVFEDFPRNLIRTEKAKKLIWLSWKTHIRYGNINGVKSFLLAYPFLEKKMKMIVDKIKSTKEENAYDEESCELIDVVTEGIECSSINLENEALEGMYVYFADIIDIIPKSVITNGVFEGIHNKNCNYIESGAKILEKYPVTKEDADMFIKDISINQLHSLENMLKYFPEYDFSNVFADVEVREKLFFQFLLYVFYYGPTSFGYGGSFFADKLNIPQLSTKDYQSNYIEDYIKFFKKYTENGIVGYKHILLSLLDFCKDSINDKYRNYVGEIEALLFRDSANNLGTSVEDLKAKLVEDFIEGCKKLSLPSIENYEKQYVINNHKKLVIEASIQGVLNFLDVSMYKKDMDVYSLLNTLTSFFFCKMSFLVNEMQDERIKKSIVTLKHHFLSQGWFNEIKKINNLFDKLFVE